MALIWGRSACSAQATLHPQPGINLVPPLYFRPAGAAGTQTPESGRDVDDRPPPCPQQQLLPHNSQRLVKGKSRCNILIHPQDAERLGVTDGDDLTLRSEVGGIALPAWVSDDIMPGVISVPHGWGMIAKVQMDGNAVPEAPVSTMWSVPPVSKRSPPW